MTRAVALAVGAPHQKRAESSGGRVIRGPAHQHAGIEDVADVEGRNCGFFPADPPARHADRSLSRGRSSRRRARAAGAARLHSRRLCPPNPALPRAAFVPESCGSGVHYAQYGMHGRAAGTRKPTIVQTASRRWGPTSLRQEDSRPSPTGACLPQLEILGNSECGTGQLRSAIGEA